MLRLWYKSYYCLEIPLRTWLLVAALAAAAVAAQPPAPGFVERFKAATAAYEAKDYARMEAELREALKLRPAHPTATYNLASALALRGEPKAAVETLEQLADMGLSFDPAADADFGGLKDDRGFASVRRAFARNREPRGRADRAFRLASPEFIPEGIAYDADRGDFYVGSVHERRIQRVEDNDEEHDFVKAGAGGLWAPLGMTVDTRRDLLWVASAALPEMKDAVAGELGRSAILAYDLRSGAPKHRFVLEDGAGPHALGDLIVLRDGTIYTTDSRAGVLYSLDPATGKFTALTQPGALASPQGLALSRDRRKLHIADYTQGLYSYDLKSGSLTRVEAGKDVCLYGIDGLYRYEDDLIAVQNGVRPHRVVRLRLAASGRRVASARVLAASLKEFDEPTLGVVVGRKFYFVANSQWGRFDAQHRLPPGEALSRPLVLRLALDGEEREGRSTGSEPRASPSTGPRLPVPCVPGVSC